MNFISRISMKYYITSGISDIVFHYTSLPNAVGILKENRFSLTFVSGADDTHNPKPKSKFYYLSTTRSKLGDYHIGSAGYFGVLFKLDGRKLKHNYIGNPVDYWGHEFRKVAPTKHEMEDRIWSDKPFISPASKFIEEIHIYFGKTKDDADESIKKWLKALVIEADHKHIPFFIYTDKNAALSLDKRKATPLSELDLSGIGDIETNKYGKRDSMEVWLELYEKTDRDDLSTSPFGGAKRIADNIYRFDNIQGFKADVHNSKKGTPSLHKIVEILKKKNWDIIDFYKFLQKKWSSN